MRVWKSISCESACLLLLPVIIPYQTCDIIPRNFQLYLVLLFYKAPKNIFKAVWIYDFLYSNTNKPWTNIIFNVLSYVDFIIGQCFLLLLTLVLWSITWPCDVDLKIVKRKYKREIEKLVSAKGKVVLFRKHQLCIGIGALLVFTPMTSRTSQEPEEIQIFSLRYRGCVVLVSIGAGHPMICSLNFDKMRLSLKFSVCCKARFLGERRDTQLSGEIRKTFILNFMLNYWVFLLSDLTQNTLGSYSTLLFILMICLFPFVIIHSIYFLQD